SLPAAQRDHAVRLIARFAKRPPVQAASPAEGPALTLRETEILSLVAANMSNQKIAEATGITLETVKWNLKNIFQKLGVADRYDAVMRARRTGLLD
ncbi:MAG TPA: LuxR C-terminal-related transcriptional regulator, partial [Sphingopyxis sp.]|nr:LuxR C-terminal-related transcriptional regulator [Sphingopyxis sp.]